MLPRENRRGHSTLIPGVCGSGGVGVVAVVGEVAVGEVPFGGGFDAVGGGEFWFVAERFMCFGVGE